MLNSSHRHMLLLLVSIVTVILTYSDVTLNGSLGKKIACILILLHLTVSVTSTQSDRQTLRQTATYLCTGTHTHIHMHTRMHACFHMHTIPVTTQYVHTDYARTYACTHTCLHMHPHKRTHTHSHACHTTHQATMCI